MSTKIYNGFKIKNLTLHEQKLFLDELKEKLIPVYIESYCQVLADRLIKIIDSLTILDEEKDFEKIEKDLMLYYRQQMSFEKLTKSVCRNLPVDADRTQVLRAFDKSYFTMRGLLDDILEQSMKVSAISSDIFSLETDFRADIVFLPLSESETLLMTYSNNFTKFFNTLCDDNEFSKKYELEDYFYQNQSDKPKWISEKDWDKRKSDWDTVLKTGIPSKDGIVVNVMDVDLFRMHLFDYDISDKIIEKLPSKEERIEKNANSRAFDAYWKIYAEKHNIDFTNNRVYSEVMSANSEFKEKLESNDKEVVTLLKAEKTKLKRILNDVNKANITKLSVLYWVPNYRKSIKDVLD